MKTRRGPKRREKNAIRLFRGLPVVEARADLLVQPSAGDIKHAKPKDPQNCAFAQCMKRTLNATSVFVFRSVAYVQTLDEDGNPVMERYHVKQRAAKYLIDFDENKPIEPGGFRFQAPPRSQTLDYRLKAQRKRSEAGKDWPRKSTGNPKVKHRTYTMRFGTGHVHLFGKEDQIK